MTDDTQKRNALGYTPDEWNRIQEVEAFYRKVRGTMASQADLNEKSVEEREAEMERTKTELRALCRVEKPMAKMEYYQRRFRFALEYANAALRAAEECSGVSALDVSRIQMNLCSAGEAMLRELMNLPSVEELPVVETLQKELEALINRIEETLGLTKL